MSYDMNHSQTSEVAAPELKSWTDTKFSLWALIGLQPAEVMSERTRHLLDTRGYSRIGWVCQWFFPALSTAVVTWLIGLFLLTPVAMVAVLFEVHKSLGVGGGDLWLLTLAGFSFGVAAVAAVAAAHRSDVSRSITEDLTRLGYPVGHVTVSRRFPGDSNYVTAFIRNRDMNPNPRIWVSEKGFHEYLD